jgi:uncharacterized protein (DUF427 family)
MPSGRSLYREMPGHTVELEACDAPVCARFNGRVVADSARALVVKEADYPPVIYFPRDDVRFEFLERTDHASFCPFKGDASYWTLRVDDRFSENAVWSYEDTFPEVAGLKDHLAFYPDRVEWEREG